MDKNSDKDPLGKPNPLIEKQIEEILRSSERTFRRRMLWNRVSNGATRSFRRLGQGGGRGTPFGRLMLWGLVLTLLGAFIAQIPPARAIASLVVLAGIILFISPIFLSFRTGGRRGGGSSVLSSDDKYWRGRRVEDFDERWQATRQQVSGVMRWLRGGDKNPPRGGSRR